MVNKKIKIYLLPILFTLTFYSIEVNAQFANFKKSSFLHPQVSTSLANYKAGDLKFAASSGMFNYLAEFAYSPIKNISINANTLRYFTWRRFDYSTKVGIGPYYFFKLNRIRNKKEKINNKFGMTRGFLIDANLSAGFGNLFDISSFNSYDAIYRMFGQEIGIHYFGRILSFHASAFHNTILFKDFLVSNNSPDYILNIVDLLKEDKKFNSYSINLRQTFGIKQSQLFVSVILPYYVTGDERSRFLSSRFGRSDVEFSFGAIINISSIIKKELTLGNIKKKK